MQAADGKIRNNGNKIFFSPHCFQGTSRTHAYSRSKTKLLHHDCLEDNFSFNRAAEGRSQSLKIRTARAAWIRPCQLQQQPAHPSPRLHRLSSTLCPTARGLKKPQLLRSSRTLSAGQVLLSFLFLFFFAAICCHLQLPFPVAVQSTSRAALVHAALLLPALPSQSCNFSFPASRSHAAPLVRSLPRVTAQAFLLPSGSGNNRGAERHFLCCCLPRNQDNHRWLLMTKDLLMGSGLIFCRWGMKLLGQTPNLNWNIRGSGQTPQST